jgi:hypothetical protein
MESSSWSCAEFQDDYQNGQDVRDNVQKEYKDGDMAFWAKSIEITHIGSLSNFLTENISQIFKMSTKSEN